MESQDLRVQLEIAQKQLETLSVELLYEQKEKGKRAAELVIAKAELLFQNREREKRAAELSIANKELVFQNEEKEKRANELIIANKELIFQNREKQKRANELIIANDELIFQNEQRDKRIIAEAKKDQFFNMVSHELKTPLTNIKAINQIFEKSLSKTDRVYPFIAKSNNSVLRLERLIEDLLDVTKINSGEIDLNSAEFFFSDMLTECVITVQQISPKHKIILLNNVDIFYTGDQFRLERVLINLLNNAIKYSPVADKVTVLATVENDKIIVCVTDEGIGIEKKDIDKIFKRFYRVANIAKQFQGVGLGLYIAAEIVRKHKGTFTIESELGKGSTFCFSLPINR